MIAHYPDTLTTLTANELLVKFPDFENGIIKLLGGESQSLTRAERNTTAKLLAPLGGGSDGGEGTPQVSDLEYIPATANDVYPDNTVTLAGMCCPDTHAGVRFICVARGRVP